MPRSDTPPIVWIERTPKGRMVAIFADGRVAGREQGEGNTWQPIDHIDYHALWPAPAPVADELPEYDKTFGDDRTCRCGHPYYRHFDTYDEMFPVGCKYCDCHTFIETEPTP